MVCERSQQVNHTNTAGRFMVNNKNALALELFKQLVNKHPDMKYSIPAARKLAQHAFTLAEQFCKEELKQNPVDNKMPWEKN